MQSSSGRLAGKVAIITGAASGIGKGTALLFAEESASVVLVDVDAEGLAQTAGEIAALGGVCAIAQGDVSLAATATLAAETAERHFGGVDILFNNAGIMPVRGILELQETEWDQVMNVNLKSMYLMSREVIPYMLRRGRGSIVNTSSVMASLTEPGYTAYTTSKAGIIGLTKEIAVSFAERGIRCNAICPGWVETDLNVKLAESMGGMEKLQPMIKQQQPQGRMATTREVGYAALFLASDEASAVTGSCLYVDGAASAAI